MNRYFLGDSLWATDCLVAAAGRWAPRTVVRNAVSELKYWWATPRAFKPFPVLWSYRLSRTSSACCGTAYRASPERGRLRPGVCSVCQSGPGGDAVSGQDGWPARGPAEGVLPNEGARGGRRRPDGTSPVADAIPRSGELTPTIRIHESWYNRHSEDEFLSQYQFCDHFTWYRIFSYQWERMASVILLHRCLTAVCRSLEYQLLSYDNNPIWSRTSLRVRTSQM